MATTAVTITRGDEVSGIVRTSIISVVSTSAVGPIGFTGATGATGTAATISVGTTTTGAAGSSASVTNSGTSGAAVFDFTVPRGDTGATGATGATGTAATLNVGTTTTGAAGSSASVTNSGTSSAAVFNFTIPTGAQGPVGPASLSLDDVGDVTITSATANDILKWNGSAWVNDTALLALKANLVSPTFTGTPTLPTGTIATTQTAGNSTTAVATTEFVTTADNLKANIASPTFTGTVTGNPAVATTSTGTSGFGYMGLPQNSATTGAYGIIAADAGTHIYSSATRTVTIPANATIAMPVGSTIVFIAGSGATVTIAITTDTMLLAGTGTTGSRTLAPFGMATAVKITSTSWIISGNGLT